MRRGRYHGPLIIWTIDRHGPDVTRLLVVMDHWSSGPLMTMDQMQLGYLSPWTRCSCCIDRHGPMITWAQIPRSYRWGKGGEGDNEEKGSRGSGEEGGGG